MSKQAAPHVLLVVVDQWPASTMTHAGHPVVETPTMDALAAMGTRFSRCMSECPVCIPARATLMTGTYPRTHGDRVYKEGRDTPQPPYLAGCLAEAGYHTGVVGKLHVFPQRRRLGFHDFQIHEEGRQQFGVMDDYDIFLAERGFQGQQFTHGLANNAYEVRPWHLPDDCHPTAWTAQQAARMIRCRDPSKPGMWCVSFAAPHPPLSPPRFMLDYYRSLPCPEPHMGDWAGPAFLDGVRAKGPCNANAVRDARRAFWASCAFVDQQLRSILGTLREEGLLNDTWIVVTSDHGEMLGNHGLWGKRLMCDESMRVPLLVAPPAGEARLSGGAVDNRPCGLADIMPTILDAAGVPIPAQVEGLSLLSSQRHDYVYSECSEDRSATRMICDGRWKLVLYAEGARWHLFDLDEDPHECRDRYHDAACAEKREELRAALEQRLYNDPWYPQGLPLEDSPAPDRSFGNPRGLHLPPANRR